MNIAELKAAAEAARDGAGQYLARDYAERIRAYNTAVANPSTILSLIASHQALVEALRKIADGPWPDDITGPLEQARWDLSVARAALQASEKAIKEIGE